MTKLRISDDLSLPLEAVTQTFAILAKRGSGKSYTASVMAEEMLKAHQPVVALDPTGGWWGLRSGFPIAVLGGEHGDIQLQETAGEVIAQAIVENRFSAVLDLSLFRKGQMIRFMVGFLETLYRLNRDPVHLFVDEADAFAPQGRNFGGDENRMLGAMEDLVRRGRKRGIGCTLITQRPAVLNKNVLTQCESVFALRMVHPRDIGALKEWIDVHAEPAMSKDVIDSLPSLPIGEAWFWSPGWMGTLRRVTIRKRETFDSSATPKPGETVKAPKSLAKLDLAMLGKQIEATVERAKADDPRELRRRIADLERQLKNRPAETRTVEVEKVVEVPVLKNGQLDRTDRVIAKLEEHGGRVLAEAAELRRVIAPAFAKVTNVPPRPQAPPRPAAPPRPVAPPAPRQPAPPRQEGTGELTRPEQRILDALAWLEAIGVSSPENAAVAFLAGYTVDSGGYNNPRGALRMKGLLDYPTSGCVSLTEAGRAKANPPAEALTTTDLHEAVLGKLPGPEKKLLQVILDTYPNDLSMEELAERTGYALGSGGLNNPRGRLRTLGLIEYPTSGRVRARSSLFLETSHG